MQVVVTKQTMLIYNDAFPYINKKKVDKIRLDTKCRTLFYKERSAAFYYRKAITHFGAFLSYAYIIY